MNQVIQVSQDQFETLLKRLSRLKKMMAMLFKKGEPPYGTDEWWEWSDQKALEEVKGGEYFELRDKKELDDFFNNILKNKSNKKYDHKIRQTR